MDEGMGCSFIPAHSKVKPSLSDDTQGWLSQQLEGVGWLKPCEVDKESYKAGDLEHVCLGAVLTQVGRGQLQKGQCSSCG